ncbi:MAG TPA: tRNA pseudouridine(55) synthase TruB [Candidatus Eisenbacteria bacterium]|nr:tRNA pseudouridine(55) synthase TruB [Candidatus Eisenbacteria bacterium]
MADLLHLVDKPEGWTSHDAVARLRGILREERVGHAGTLDPFASGLLLVGEGRATAALAPLGLLPKRYVARARLGVVTDTQDRTGVVLSKTDRLPAAETIEPALQRFRGAIRQTPPLYSAVKVKGERLYKSARRGIEVERDDRPVHVYELALVETSLPEIALDLTVSRGTYVRTLAHDLGQALGCGAHLVSLRRLSSGPFRVEDALSCDRESGHGESDFRRRALPLHRALGFLPHVTLTDEEASRLRHGRAPSLTRDRVIAPERSWPLPPGETDWPLALTDGSGHVAGLARPWNEQAEGEPVRLLRVLAAS